jgi:hypothetical protein
MRTKVPQEPGRPRRLHVKSRLGKPDNNPGLRTMGARRARERKTGGGGTGLAKENEARRDGRLGFGASRSTDEAGELALPAPRGGKGTP